MDCNLDSMESSSDWMGCSWAMLVNSSAKMDCNSVKLASMMAM